MRTFPPSRELRSVTCQFIHPCSTWCTCVRLGPELRLWIHAVEKSIRHGPLAPSAKTGRELGGLDFCKPSNKPVEEEPLAMQPKVRCEKCVAISEPCAFGGDRWGSTARLEWPNEKPPRRRPRPRLGVVAMTTTAVFRGPPASVPAKGGSMCNLHKRVRLACEGRSFGYAASSRATFSWIARWMPVFRICISDSSR